ncbi:SRPBCC family protein [Streptomyces sp. LP05-1]|uniref:SRPBCC family protein n=1 Tax=Streptomyces pyxinae TaxID=2970734 RepID=A0ABT2CCR5_9ACTN|nr:SRPBCC family protein [Streptomyces sp. LP05-1]MCS0634907.1 SRPBCC family protein [Streptomyces sp. LP05-1]
MAVRHRLIERPPEAVWAVLADGSRYADWVVGTSSSRQKDDRWPQEGSALAYTVSVGPWTGEGETVVRLVEPGRRLELEAKSGPLGTARIAFELRPWGDATLVVVDEHPLRGPGGLLHNTAADALLQLRHRAMLRRLAEVVEREATRGNARVRAK